MKKLVIWALILGVIAYGAAKWYVHSEVSNAMDTGVLMLSPYAAIEYKGVSSTMSGKLTVDGVRIRLSGYRDDLHIDSVGINTPSFLSLLSLDELLVQMSTGGDDMPDYIGLMVEGVRMPVTADYYRSVYSLAQGALDAPDTAEDAARCTGKYGFSPDALTAMGYEEQVASASITLRNNDAQFVVDIDSNIVDMWDFNASIALAGNLFAGGMPTQPRLANLWIEYTDRSLNERVRNYCQQLGLSGDDALQAQLDAFSYMGEQNGIVFDDLIMEPYREFLSGKPTFIISAQPTEPVNLSQIGLYKPTDVPALLNLSATTR